MEANTGVEAVVIQVERKAQPRNYLYPSSYNLILKAGLRPILGLRLSPSR
jgi:hypothetical protein